MHAPIVIRDERTRQRAASFVANLAVGKPLQVDIKPFKRNRSVAQNAVYWRTITIIGNELGYSKDEMHRMVKECLLLPILERDDPDVDRLASVLKAQGEEKSLATVLSTKHLTVAQFSELIQDVESFAGDMGIGLPSPDEQYYEAMGWRR